jgi:hypothetical protein
MFRKNMLPSFSWLKYIRAREQFGYIQTAPNEVDRLDPLEEVSKSDEIRSCFPQRQPDAE